MNITKGPLAAPQRGVFYGPEGVGKTTLAASLPSPVFIDLEGGTKSYDVDRTPVPSTWDELFSIIDELAKSDYQTVVIDTADAAERLAIESVCAAEHKTGIEDFGYSKGYTYLAEAWGKFLRKLTLLSSAKHVVVVAHSQIVKFEQPGQFGNFDRYQLKLAKQLAALTKEWADCVLFVKFESILNKDKDTKKVVGIGGTNRVIYTEHRDAFDAKHRHGLAEELPCEYASIATVFPRLSVVAKSATTPPTVKQSLIVATTADDSSVVQTSAEPHPLAWFADYEQPINLKLLEKGKIKAGQTWRDLDAASVAQLKGYAKAKLAKWAGFDLEDGDK